MSIFTKTVDTDPYKWEEYFPDVTDTNVEQYINNHTRMIKIGTSVTLSLDIELVMSESTPDAHTVSYITLPAEYPSAPFVTATSTMIEKAYSPTRYAWARLIIDGMNNQNMLQFQCFPFDPGITHRIVGQITYEIED